MERPKHIVLTGGPSAGKSTALRYLEENAGHEMQTTPEVATMLLEGGFPAPAEAGPSTVWQRSFQLAIAATQIALEQVVEAQNLESDTPKPYLLFDRGLADGAAYLDGGINELSHMTGISISDMMARYDMVIHLRTSAMFPEGYRKHTNPHRSEDAARAIDLDMRTEEAWQYHPNRLIVPVPDPAARHTAIHAAIRTFS